MEQGGRYRSRIGRPSGLRPPSARGAAAAASPCPAAQERTPCPGSARGAAAAANVCPASQGIGPCPSTPTATTTRIPQSGLPRRVSRLAQPRIQRAASPPRTRPPSPQRREIPKPTGLRPPASYAAASKLPCAPRAIPVHKPKPETPTASTVPVARVVSPPREASPARTLAVPIPKDSPAAAAAIAAAAASPPRRRIPMPSRLRKPAVKTESLVAVPVVQAPGSPPKRILVPGSVVASGQGTIVAVPRTPAVDEDRNWEEIRTRLRRERGIPPRESPYRRQRRRVIRMPTVSPVSEEAEITAEQERMQRILHERKMQRYVAEGRECLRRIREAREIDRRWDLMMRQLYGDAYADTLLPRVPRRVLDPPIRYEDPSDRNWREFWDAYTIEGEEVPDVARRLFEEQSTCPRAFQEEIREGSEAVLQAIAESAAEGGSPRYGTIVGSDPPIDAAEFIENIEFPEEYALDIDLDEPVDYFLLDLEDAPQNLPPPLLPLEPRQALPPPLIPQTTTQVFERVSPTMRSPIGSPLGSPTAGYGIPIQSTSPFSMPPQVTQPQQFMDPAELEGFMTGRCPGARTEEEAEEEEEEEEDLYKILKY